MKREAAGQGTFGILLIDKPAGPTSHDVVGWVRWALRERAVGHCGTLDPPATGLLVVCVGSATKLVDYLTGVDKRYRARFVLGRSTTTADAEGETLALADPPPEIESRALACLHALVGSHELPPPVVSAVRVQGRRAHELVRAGEQPELAPRPMTVHELVIHGVERDQHSVSIDAEVSVTKGTYIRSLAEELGRRLSIPAHLGSLRRIACGSLWVDDPSVVDGLVAQQLPHIEGRPPKWRIEAGASAGAGAGAADEAGAVDDAAGAIEPRERAQAWLRERMSPPWQRLPFTVGVPGAAAAPSIARLLQGQRLRADADTLASLDLTHADAGTCAVVDRAGGHLIILQADRGRLAPVRLMRFDPRQWFEQPP